MERIRIWNQEEPELRPKYGKAYINSFRRTLHVGDKLKVEMKRHTSDETAVIERLATIKEIFPHVVLLEYKAAGRVTKVTYQIKELALNLIKWRYA